MKTRPSISILTPVYRPELNHFQECVDSVVEQTFTDWELVIVDDCSDDAALSAILDKYAGDARVKVHTRTENGGIVSASNDALMLAQGDYVALLDHDDLLVPTALEEIVAAASGTPAAEILYSDRGHVDEAGRRVGEDFLKPLWSPERLRNGMYIAHLTVMRRSAAVDVGGFRHAFEGSQDHDIVLRVSERGAPVVHVPKVLYLWRMSERSTAADPDTKPYARINGVKAVQEHCNRVGIDAIVDQGALAGLYSIKRRIPAGVKASIIIPTYGSWSTIRGVERCLVVECVRSVVRHEYEIDYEIVVVYDDRPGIDLSYLEDLHDVAGEHLRLVRFTEAFNFARKVNVGALNSSGQVLVLLNDDTEVISEDWLDHLCGLALESDVGVVGLKLLLENGLVQHGGIGVVRSGNVVNVDQRRPNGGGYYGSLISDHEVMGVTGACLAVRANLYSEVGGFSEDFAGSFNDVDFCFKVLTLGYRNIAANTISLYHYESLTRDPEIKPSEHDNLYGRWLWLLHVDPYLRGMSQPK